MNANETNDNAATPTPADVDAIRVLAEADPAAKLAREIHEATQPVTLEEFAAPVATL